MSLCRDIIYKCDITYNENEKLSYGDTSRLIDEKTGLYLIEGMINSGSMTLILIIYWLAQQYAKE